MIPSRRSALVISAALLACSSAERRTLDHDAGDSGGTMDARVPSPTLDLDGARLSDGETWAELGDAERDASGALDEAQPCSGPLPVLNVRDPDTNLALAPDFSCYTRDDGDAGSVAVGRDASVVASRLVTFSFPGWSPEQTADLTVDFFYGPSTRGEPAATRTFLAQASGVAFDAPASVERVSVRMRALMRDDPALSIPELRLYDLPIRADDTVEGYVHLRDMRGLGLRLVLGSEPEDPDKALILARARDCQGRELEGAQLVLIDGETNLPVVTGSEGALPRVSYTRYDLPNPSCTFSSNGIALFMLVHAPVNVSRDVVTHPYRLRLQGRMSARDEAPVVFAERDIELFAGTTSFVTLYRESAR